MQSKMAKTGNKKFEIKNRYNRHFSEEFKRSKVQDIIANRISIKDVSKIYDVSRTSLYNWIYLYSTMEKNVKTVVQMDSEAQKVKVLLKRLSEYERIIGQKQMTIDLLEKGYESLNKELGYDVKKKYVQAHWSGSDTIEKNTDTK